MFAATEGEKNYGIVESDRQLPMASFQKHPESCDSLCDINFRHARSPMIISRPINSFRDLTFEKMVILDVSMTGAMNLALPPNVCCIIFQLLEVLSKLDTWLLHAMDASPS